MPDHVETSLLLGIHSLDRHTLVNEKLQARFPDRYVLLRQFKAL